MPINEVLTAVHDYVPAQASGAEDMNVSAEEDRQLNYVLVSGAFHDSEYWRLLEKELAELGHNTITPVLHNSGPQASFDDNAELVRQAIDGYDDIAFVGHSRSGAEVVPRVLPHIHPARVVGFVALSSGGPGGTRTHDILLKSLQMNPVNQDPTDVRTLVRKRYYALLLAVVAVSHCRQHC